MFLTLAQLSSDRRFGMPLGTKLLSKSSLDVRIAIPIFAESSSFMKNFYNSSADVPPPSPICLK